MAGEAGGELADRTRRLEEAVRPGLAGVRQALVLVNPAAPLAPILVALAGGDCRRCAPALGGALKPSGAGGEVVYVEASPRKIAPTRLAAIIRR